MKPWEEIIRDNVFCLGGNRDHVPSCLSLMLYCIATTTPFNLAYFMVKRMEYVRDRPSLLLPYGMLLTRVFNSIIRENPELRDGSYVMYPRVMNPLTAHVERKVRKDRGTRRSMFGQSSSSTPNQRSSSHHNDENEVGNDEETSRVSTPSPTRYVNSLTDEIPCVFENPPDIDPSLEPLYSRQTEILNRQIQIRDEHQGGLRSIGKGIRNLLGKKKKK